MIGGVVSDSVLPAVPDDVEPGSGEDADRMGVVVSAGDGAVVEVGGPGVGASAVAGEIGDRVAELFVCRPTESDVLDVAGLAGGGRDSGQAGQRFGGGERARQSPISLSSRAARTVPERGSEVKMCASAWRVSCSAMSASRALIWATRLDSTATKARVVAVPSAPALPRAAPVSRR